MGRKANVAVVLTLAGYALVACAGSEESLDSADAAVAEAGGPEAALAMDPPAVRFAEPADGAEVTSPVRIRLAVENLQIVPAGEQVPASGHHHILVDVDAPAPGTPIPSIDGHFHYGQAQTEFEIEMTSGEHRLIALVGDFAHIPLDPSAADHDPRWWFGSRRPGPPAALALLAA